jgi:hypothetical protein
VATEDQKSIFTYLHPGCVIYQWDVSARTILNRLDCSKLIPCSESLKTINIDDQFSPGRCQVSTLAVVGSLLYIGTCWGCLVVAETGSLRPVTVFRPYSEEIESLVSLTPRDGPQCLVSIGRGYRNLIGGRRAARNGPDGFLPQAATARRPCLQLAAGRAPGTARSLTHHAWHSVEIDFKSSRSILPPRASFHQPSPLDVRAAVANRHLGNGLVLV